MKKLFETFYGFSLVVLLAVTLSACSRVSGPSDKEVSDLMRDHSSSGLVDTPDSKLIIETEIIERGKVTDFGRYPSHPIKIHVVKKLRNNSTAAERILSDQTAIYYFAKKPDAMGNIRWAVLN
jgi:hypothetical protein